jgi:outer membrane receptor protein involved in Fe transport
LCLWSPLYAQISTDPDTESETEIQVDEEIVVSGEKMGRKLEETASSVAIFSAEELAEGTQKDLYEIVNRTANVGQSFGGLGFNIRGIDQRGFGGTTNPTLSIFVDGGILNNVETFFGPLSTWDLEQLEIFRGPQSTTQGRNSLAGAIVLRSQRPTNEWDFKSRLLGGEEGSRQYAVAFGGPIIKDELTFRVSGERREHDGFIFNNFLQENADAHESDLYRFKLAYTPRNLDNLSILLSVVDSDSSGGEDSLDAINTFAREVNYDTSGSEGVDMQIYSMEAEYVFNDRWSLNLQFSTSESEHLRTEDIDNTPANFGVLDVEDINDNTTQELRVNYTNNRVRAMVGVYHTDEDTPGNFDVTLPIAFLDPSLPADIFVTRQSENIQAVENVAVFGEADWTLSERWTLTTGFRYDQEDRSIQLRNETEPLTPLPPPLDQLLAPFFGSDDNFSDTDFDAFLPKLALTYAHSEQITTGFSIQRAYRSGGSGNSLSGFNFTFDPEFTTNYEAFLRTRSADGKWSTNLNIFYVDWTDQQVGTDAPTGLPNDTITVNAGESRLQGLELEATYQAARGLDFFTAIGRSDSEFTNFVQDGVDFSGNAFPYAADWTATLGATYRHVNGFFGTANAAYTDDVFANVFNGPDTLIENYTIVNLKLGWEMQQWGIFLEGRNLLDEDYFTSLNRSTNFARAGDPRVVSLVVDFNF